MSITLSQDDYGDLFDAAWQKHTDGVSPANEPISYPPELGCGTFQSLVLREGLTLDIESYQLHDQVIVKSPARSHPLEYTFLLAAETSPTKTFESYTLYGSGTAPAETFKLMDRQRYLAVSVHIEPEVMQRQMGATFNLLEPRLSHLMKPPEQCYYERSGTPTGAMQTTLHQLLSCPLEALTRNLYLESKVWELMALLLEEELTPRNEPQSALKAEDVDRIYRAKDILIGRMDHPPSLVSLAHLVGLNDCTLKRGFRQVFGTTAYGYLQDHRLEQARQLLQKQEKNVTEIARIIGFKSSSSFSRAFRQKYGIAPKQYSKSA